MMARLLLVILALCFCMFAMAETRAEHESRMKWWREARFGMFIHWGLYAIPGGKWGNSTGHGEWIRETAHIPVEEYEKFKAQWNPTKFDADAWVKAAKQAGMKYIVITTKHHDGFNLFDSPFSDWSVRSTPDGRDIMAEIARACRKYKMRIGWYHSIMDWHHPDYLPRRSWEGASRPADGANFPRFVEYLKNELTFILTHYGQIDVLWFDGEWESTWTSNWAEEIFSLCRKVSPKTIINNRVGNARAGEMNDAGPVGQLGDYGTPEQFIPATGLPGQDWETCMTMNDHWGYNAVDKDFKPAKELIRNLIDIVSKGGNYLLNVGPTAEGVIPSESLDRLSEIGSWMAVNSESIYGTIASPFASLDWGRATSKGRTLYLHVFDWPKNGKLRIPGLGTDPASAIVLGGSAVKWHRVGPDVIVDLPARSGNEVSSTLKLGFRSRPVVYRPPTLCPVTTFLIDSADVPVQNADPKLTVRYTLDGSVPTANSPVAGATVRVSGPCTVTAASFHEGKRVSETVSVEMTRPTPLAAVEAGKTEAGLKMTDFDYRGEVLPDFSKLTPRRTEVFAQIELAYPGKPDEHAARLYEGLISVPKTAVYVFALASDDGSKLYLDGHLIVDNDGAHGVITKQGSVALAKGLHRIRVEWFNAGGAADLALSMCEAGQPLRAVAPSDLRH